MSWNARLKAALHGEVPGADVAAMLAATAPLGALEQELADRRFAAEVTHAGHEWRVATALSPIAAPLWLADALATLAQSLLEAETASHPDRPSDLDPAVHVLAATVLRPVESIIAEVSAALVDPLRPSGLTAPLTVGPRGAIASYPLPYPVPAPYARGLLLAARRILGSAQVALDDTTALAARAPAPAWLTAGLQRVSGELRATAARLEMMEVQAAPLLRAPHPDQDALARLSGDAWDIVNTALVSGQALREPHLLPGAPPPEPPGQGVPRAIPPAAPAAPALQAPIHPAPMSPAPAPAQPVPLPHVPRQAGPDQVAPPHQPAPEHALPLPRIDESGHGATVPPRQEPIHPALPASSAVPGPSHPHAQEPVALPQIGPNDAGATGASTHQDSPTKPRDAHPDSHPDEPRPFQFPEIGPT